MEEMEELTFRQRSYRESVTDPAKFRKLLKSQYFSVAFIIS